MLLITSFCPDNLVLSKCKRSKTIFAFAEHDVEPSIKNLIRYFVAHKLAPLTKVKSLETPSSLLANNKLPSKL
jgi:hypothetical protein